MFLRAIVESGRQDVVPVAINDLGSVEANAPSAGATIPSTAGCPARWRWNGDSITIHAHGKSWGPIKVSAQRDPAQVPFAGVDVAMECTGLFTTRDSAGKLLAAGARKVIVSAPADGVDATIVYGVNHDTLTADMSVISNASCTTNCLAPMAKVLQDSYGHCARLHADGAQLHRRPAHAGYAAQGSASRPRRRRVVDPHLHRCRARRRPGAAGALKGKLDGSAIRVPTPNVSLVSLDVVAGTHGPRWRN